MLVLLSFFSDNTDLQVATFIGVVILLFVGLYPLIRR